MHMAQQTHTLRDEIERTVKRLQIDRTRFYEYSKQRYENILSRFYQEMFELPRRQMQYQFYPWTNIRKKWQRAESVGLLQHDGDWASYLEKVRGLLPVSDDAKLYLITAEDFVYEGCPPEIIRVLAEADLWLLDFYLVSAKFEWFVVYCDDGDCATLYRKGETL